MPRTLSQHLKMMGEPLFIYNKVKDGFNTMMYIWILVFFEQPIQWGSGSIRGFHLNGNERRRIPDREVHL